ALAVTLSLSRCGGLQSKGAVGKETNGITRCNLLSAIGKFDKSGGPGKPADPSRTFRPEYLRMAFRRQPRPQILAPARALVLLESCRNRETRRLLPALAGQHREGRTAEYQSADEGRNRISRQAEHRNASPHAKCQRP